MKMQRFRDVGNEEGIYGNGGYIYIIERYRDMCCIYILTSGRELHRIDTCYVTKYLNEET